MFRQSLSVCQCFCTAHSQKLLFQNSDTAIVFDDPDFLYGSIFWRSVGIYHVTLTFDPLILNIGLSSVS